MRCPASGKPPSMLANDPTLHVQHAFTSTSDQSGPRMLEPIDGETLLLHYNGHPAPPSCLWLTFTPWRPPSMPRLVSRSPLLIFQQSGLALDSLSFTKPIFFLSATDTARDWRAICSRSLGPPTPPLALFPLDELSHGQRSLASRRDSSPRREAELSPPPKPAPTFSLTRGTLHTSDASCRHCRALRPPNTHRAHAYWWA